MLLEMVIRFEAVRGSELVEVLVLLLELEPRRIRLAIDSPNPFDAPVRRITGFSEVELMVVLDAQDDWIFVR